MWKIYSSSSYLFNYLDNDGFKWNEFLRFVLLNSLAPLHDLIYCIYWFIEYLDYLSFYGYSNKCFSFDRLVSFTREINDFNLSEEFIAILRINYINADKSQSNKISISDVISIMEKYSFIYAPIIEFHKLCGKYIFGSIYIDSILIRLSEMTYIKQYKCLHHGQFPKGSFIKYITNLIIYGTNPYSYDFELSQEESDLTCYSLVNDLINLDHPKKAVNKKLKQLKLNGEKDNYYCMYNSSKSGGSKSSRSKSSRVTPVSDSDINSSYQISKSQNIPEKKHSHLTSGISNQSSLSPTWTEQLENSACNQIELFTVEEH